MCIRYNEYKSVVCMHKYRDHWMLCPKSEERRTLGTRSKPGKGGWKPKCENRGQQASLVEREKKCTKCVTEEKERDPVTAGLFGEGGSIMGGESSCPTEKEKAARALPKSSRPREPESSRSKVQKKLTQSVENAHWSQHATPATDPFKARSLRQTAKECTLGAEKRGEGVDMAARLERLETATKNLDLNQQGLTRNLKVAERNAKPRISGTIAGMDNLVVRIDGLPARVAKQVIDSNDPGPRSQYPESVQSRSSGIRKWANEMADEQDDVGTVDNPEDVPLRHGSRPGSDKSRSSRNPSIATRSAKPVGSKHSERTRGDRTNQAIQREREDKMGTKSPKSPSTDRRESNYPQSESSTSRARSQSKKARLRSAEQYEAFESPAQRDRSISSRGSKPGHRASHETRGRRDSANEDAEGGVSESRSLRHQSIESRRSKTGSRTSSDTRERSPPGSRSHSVLSKDSRRSRASNRERFPTRGRKKYTGELDDGEEDISARAESPSDRSLRSTATRHGMQDREKRRDSKLDSSRAGSKSRIPTSRHGSLYTLGSRFPNKADEGAGEEEEVEEGPNDEPESESGSEDGNEDPLSARAGQDSDEDGSVSEDEYNTTEDGSDWVN